jgi:lambda family phage portal protein
MTFFDWVRGKLGKPAVRDNYAATYGSGAPGGFAGGSVGRLTASLATWSGAVNYDLDGSLVILRARARQLAANNEYGRRFLSLVAANIVGNGETPKLQVRAYFAGKPGAQPSLDKAANDAIELAWWKWGRNAGISGLTLHRIMCICAKGAARDGEALVRIIRRRDLPNGIALQLLEADRLDENLNLATPGRTIRQGVEIDGTGKPVAYWIKTSHPGDRYNAGAADVERIPAQDIIHLYLPERAEQVRGYTWFHAILLRAHQLAGFNDAAVLAARIGASKIAALERSEEAVDATAGMADGQTGGAFQMNVEAGELFELPPGYKLNSWDPDYPHANFEAFVKAAMRGISAGLDVATHNLSGDMTDVNYSSARIAELAERDQWMQLQDWFISTLVDRIYREWLALALLRGDIQFNSGKSLPAERLAKFLDASYFRGRRWKWVDPAKEIKAAQEAVALGVTSRTRLAGEQGEDFDDILAELAQEDGMIDAAGLKPAAPEPPKPKPEDEDTARAIKAMLARAAEPAAAPHVTIHQAAPVISVTTPEVRNDINVQPAAAPLVEVKNEITTPAPVVNVESRVEAVMPDQAAPVVNVNVEAVMPDELKTAITSMPKRKTTSAIKRNDANEITSTTQTEQDA